MKQKIFTAIAAILIIPFVLFEYIVLVWFWSGDGTFSLISTPIIFLFYLFIELCIMRRLALTNIFRTIVIGVIVLLTPILSMLSVWLLSLTFGIDISIA